MSLSDLASLSPDHFTKEHAYTKNIHRDEYPAIDPTSSALSQAGKVVIITGASSGIGANGWAPAFAKARPKALVLVARDLKRLEATKAKIQKINPDVEIMLSSTQISEPDSVAKLFDEVKSKYGYAHVLVNNAGTFQSSENIVKADPVKWWGDFEANVKAPFLMTRGFLKLLEGAGKDVKASVITMSTDQATQAFSSVSSYGISKLAALRLMEFVSVENPEVSAVCIQPGVVMSPMVVDAYKKFALDTPELVGGSGVWLATDAARFLSGRFVSANWDVEDLVAMKEQILGSEDLKMIYAGKFGLEKK